MTALRRYCWRGGHVVNLEDGERCPECSSTNHDPVEPQTICGHFAACEDRHGHPCTLPIGHDGPHASPGCDRNPRA